MAVPNKREWLKVFAEVFKDLDKRQLAPHAQILFNEEFLVHKITCTSWFKCKQCNKTWHSFKGSMEFKYGLKKEGKPKRRIGKVTMIPYGQQCLNCFQPPTEAPPTSEEEIIGEEEQQGLHQEREEVKSVEPIYWMPQFDSHTIKETLLKVREKVEKKFYLEKTESSTYKFYKSLPPAVNNNREKNESRSHRGDRRQYEDEESLPEPRHHKKQEGDPKYDGRRRARRPRPQDDDTGNEFEDDENVAKDVIGRGDENDDDDESIIDGIITEGPHKTDLCEACKKGKCSYNQDGGSIHSSVSTSGRESRQGNGRISKPPSNLDDIADGSGLPNKVKWHLLFQNL